MATMYFLYSEEQINEKNKVLARANKKFEPGTIAINGRKVKFTQLSTSPTLSRFVDTKIVATGDPTSFTYTEPKTIVKKG